MLDERANAYVLTFYEQSQPMPELLDVRFVVDAPLKPESIVSLSYNYLWVPIKPQIPIYSFSTYMKEVWSSQQ